MDTGKPTPLSEINLNTHSLQSSIGTGGYRGDSNSGSEHDFEIEEFDECEMVSDITAISRAVDQRSREPKGPKRSMFLPCLLFIVSVSAVLIIHRQGSSNASGEFASKTVMTGNQFDAIPIAIPSRTASNKTESKSVEGNIIEFTIVNLNTNANTCTHIKETHVLQCIPSHNEATDKFRIRLHPEWAPVGVQRFKDLTASQFWREVRIFRIVPDFISQFGISSDPDVAKSWSSMTLQDDPVIKTNDRGTVSFATSGVNTRTTQLFINTNDNWYLDSEGFAPIGEVPPSGEGYGGMEVVNEFYSGYGEKPKQRDIRKDGAEYLMKEFPLLSYFVTAEFVDQDDVFDI